MIRTLALIAIVSLALAVGCIDGALAIMGGPFWVDETGQVHRVDWRGAQARHAALRLHRLTPPTA